ncbi:MAG: MotA/TolQ/ExbB proton channel family protein [Verrucomicrobiota bacterium]
MLIGLAVAIPPLFAQNGFSYALKESSWPGIVVVVCLVILSCFSWAVMVTKMRMVSRAKKETTPFLDAYRDCNNPLALFHEGTHHTGTPLFMVYQDGAAEMHYQLTGERSAGEEATSVPGGNRVVTSQMQTVERSIDRAIGESVIKLESQMSILATAVSGAPFLGLLGTVWGVMDTFSGVASAGGAASLKTMAPGVSAALVTTVVALLVAIPAMFGYNFIVNSIKQLIAQLENFAAEMRSDFDRAFLQHSSGLGEATPAPIAIARRAVEPALKEEVESPRISARDLLGKEKNGGGNAEPGKSRPPRRIARKKNTDTNGELPLAIEDPDVLES